MEEIYKVFSCCNVTEEELNKWIGVIEIDRKKEEAKIVDLALCVLVKFGLNKNNVKELAREFKRARSIHLYERLNYLSEYVVK